MARADAPQEGSRTVGESRFPEPPRVAPPDRPGRTTRLVEIDAAAVGCPEHRLDPPPRTAATSQDARHETWIFGEEWSLTGDDERLTAVLTKFLSKLGLDVELANSGPVLREDGSDAIPDLIFGRRLETTANEFAHLVVELKRPSHILDDEDVSQLRSYSSSIVNDDRFDQPNTSWEFLLVRNKSRKSVNEMREQINMPYGVVQPSRKYKIVVRSWAELVGDAEHKMKFVQDALQYESSRDSGIAHLHDKCGKYLPEMPSSESEIGA